MPELIPNKTFSIVKSIGIILIVIGHSALKTPLYTFAYLVNIVIFFFVAGYFFNDNYLEKPLLFFKKKIIRFYIPWVVFGVAFVLLHNTFLDLHLIQFKNNPKTLLEPYNLSDIIEKTLSVLTFFGWKEPLLDPLWFLLGMFTGLSSFFAISFFAKKISATKFELYRAILMLVFTLIGFVGATYQLPLGIVYRPLIIAGLIYVGKLYRIYENKIKLSPIIAGLCLAELCVATVFNYKVNVGGMVFGNPLLFIVISISGCYLILVLAHFISLRQGYLSTTLEYIGNRTFMIMILHFLAFKVAALIQIWICGYPIKHLTYYPVIPFDTAYWWVLYTFFGICIPLLCAAVVLSIKEKSGLSK